MPDSTKSQQPKLLDQVRQVLRLHHSSIHTERSYVDWIVRFVRFHSMRSREDLFPAEAKIESFLTDLAVHANVAPATQNQAMNALVFLYKRVLNHPLQDSINAVRADKKMNVPVIMTREEVAAVISLMDGTAQVVAKLLYGNGLRIMEAVWLRVKDVDFQRKFFQRACPLLPALDIVGIFMPHRVLPEVEHRGRQLRSRPSFKQRLQGTVCAPKE